MLYHFLIISAVLTIVFLPWQLYIFNKFPEEARWENNYNLRRITDAVGGHSGTFFYHFYKAAVIWNEFIYLPLLWIIYKTFKTRFEKKYLIVAVWIFIPYLFFSLVKTKMQGYLLFAGPAVFITLSAFLLIIKEYKHKYISQWLKKSILILAVLFSVRYSIERIKPFDKRKRNPEWAQQLRSLNKIKDEKVVLFNIDKNIRAMFYADYAVYPGVPSEEQLNIARKKGYKIIINDNGTLPKKIINDPDVTFIKLSSL